MGGTPSLLARPLTAQMIHENLKRHRHARQVQQRWQRDWLAQCVYALFSSKRC